VGGILPPEILPTRQAGNESELDKDILEVFSKRNLARQFPRLLRTPANQLLYDLADF